jgi:hypothetical protein
MKHFITILCLSLIALPVVYSQVVRTNEKGEKIIEYPDGTWEPFVEQGTEDPLGAAPPPREWEEPDPEEAARKKAIQIAEALNAEAMRLGNFAEETSKKRLQLEEELSDMLANPDLYPVREADEKRRQLNLEKEREKLALTLYDHAIRMARDAELLIYLKPKKREKQLKLLEQQKAQLDAQKTMLSAAQPEPVVPAVPETKVYAAYDPAKDTRLSPPAFPCVFTHKEVDKFTGKLRRDLEPVLLFTHTPKDLRPFLRDREYITCRGYLADLSDGLLFLSLEFSIASNNAPAAFGGIPNGSIMSILPMKGETIRLFNSKTDAGFFDSGRGVYVYRAQYQISGLQEKVLQSMELDKIRVIWATGYEDYEVFDLDFFRNQINCLRSGI